MILFFQVRTILQSHFVWAVFAKSVGFTSVPDAIGPCVNLVAPLRPITWTNVLYFANVAQKLRYLGKWEFISCSPDATTNSKIMSTLFGPYLVYFLLLFVSLETIWFVKKTMKIQDSYLRNWLLDLVVSSNIGFS